VLYVLRIEADNLPQLPAQFLVILEVQAQTGDDVAEGHVFIRIS
jgi:DNA-directed RNA polymerase subunit H (RpoH/RPB5)